MAPFRHYFGYRLGFCRRQGHTWLVSTTVQLHARHTIQLQDISWSTFIEASSFILQVQVVGAQVLALVIFN